MPILHLGPAGDAFAGAFGGVAALLLLGGPMLLRWQRNRQQFVLAQAALAQGVTQFPKGPPFWLMSLRQGIMAFTVGAALLIIGAIATWMTSGLVVPPVSATPTVVVKPIDAPPPVASTRAIAEPAAPVPAHAGGPLPNPALDEWRRLKTINSLGLMSLAAGFLLALLGSVRIVFARTERLHYHEENLP